jgi:RNA polymerase sigma factor (sigma-70 family)
MTVEPWANLPDTASTDPAPDAQLLRDHEQALPRAAFADLPRVHQEVLHLRFVEELDHAAIAERLETTEHAARQRVYRAMQALRALARQRQLGLDNP